MKPKLKILPQVQTSATSYVIYWESKENGMFGTGTKRMGRAEAVALAAELNRDYPHIGHVTRPG